MENNLSVDMADILAKSTIKDINTTRANLISACNNLENAELRKENYNLTTQFISQVFYELRKNMKSTDINDFSALEFAALDIAAYIDTRNIYPRPAFHNRAHFLLVQCCGRVIDKLNQEIALKNKIIPTLSGPELACSAIIDLAHDLDHTGDTNMINGFYKPMKLEKISFERMVPFLRKNGVNQQYIELIEAAILASDPNVPKKIMHYHYTKHFLDNGHNITRPPILDIVPVLDNLCSPYETLDNILQLNPKASFLAARLSDADLLPSFGLSTARSDQETQKLHEEFIQNGNSALCNNKKILARPRLFALLNILGGQHSIADHKFHVTFSTPSAQLLGNAHAHQLQLDAEAALGLEETHTLYKAANIAYALS